MITCREAWSLVAPIIAAHMNRIPYEGELSMLDQAYIRIYGACVKQDEREENEKELFE